MLVFTRNSLQREKGRAQYEPKREEGGRGLLIQKDVPKKRLTEVSRKIALRDVLLESKVAGQPLTLFCVNERSRPEREVLKAGVFSTLEKFSMRSFHIVFREPILDKFGRDNGIVYVDLDGFGGVKFFV